jgi:hypothetical protein
MELMAEMVLDVVGSVLKYTIDIRGAGVAAVVDLSAMLQVLVGAGGDPPIAKVFKCAKGVQGVLNGSCHNDLFVA